MEQRISNWNFIWQSGNDLGCPHSRGELWKVVSPLFYSMYWILLENAIGAYDLPILKSETNKWNAHRIFQKPPEMHYGTTGANLVLHFFDLVYRSWYFTFCINFHALRAIIIALERWNSNLKQRKSPHRNFLLKAIYYFIISPELILVLPLNFLCRDNLHLLPFP